MTLADQFRAVRNRSINICAPLQTEDYVVQPVIDVSPPKWHLGHTTWFFETFILKEKVTGYKEFDSSYNFVFNSYYETVGARVVRTDRGNLSRPGVNDVYRYREYVDEAMYHYLQNELSNEEKQLLTLGLNHEEQHQELLWTDIKYILGHNPLLPPYNMSPEPIRSEGLEVSTPVTIPEGVYEIGYSGDEFCFDNELNPHKVYLNAFEIEKELVTNSEYLEFMSDGGYDNFIYWHAEGWEWVRSNQVKSPLYWHDIDNQWMNYTLHGLRPVDGSEPVCHISYFEAVAYAAWRGRRLPTEQEWETASDKLNWGKRWEWTESAYLPYPGFTKMPGAIGEYNGKFMVNQMVLRGASEVTSPGHSRKTYRNFFQTNLRWQYTGIRLAK